MLVVCMAEFKPKAKMEETGIEDNRHKCTKSAARGWSEEVIW